MARIAGGTKVESGYYVNVRSLAVVALPASGTLPGGASDRFARVPWPLLLVAAPVVGGLFVLTYPVLGISMMAWGLARKAVGAASEGATGLAGTLAPGPVAGEAHLTGEPGEGGEVKDPSLKDLEREIAERRRPQ